MPHFMRGGEGFGVVEMLEQTVTAHSAPLAIRIRQTGIAVIFRYGVVVLIGMSQQEENDFLENVVARVSGKFDRPEEETASIQIMKEDADQVPVGGPIQVKAMSPERLFVVSDALAKSVVLAHDERQVARVTSCVSVSTR